MLFNSVKEERRDISNYSTAGILQRKKKNRKFFTSGENNNFFLSNDIKYFVMTGGYTQCKNSKVTTVNLIPF